MPGQLNPLGFIAGADGVQRLDFWLVVVALVPELQQYVRPRPLRVVADAYFSKASFLNPLIARRITVISRLLRKDAVGRDDPAPTVGKRPRGRPRKQRCLWKLATLLDVEPVTELTLRDLKQYGGLGNYQCSTLLAIHRFVHLALTACCLWRLTMLQDQQAPWLTAATASPAGELTSQVHFIAAHGTSEPHKQPKYPPSGSSFPMRQLTGQCPAGTAGTDCIHAA